PPWCLEALITSRPPATELRWVGGERQQMTEHVAAYDLVVVGGGPAGEKAAAQAAFWGKRVAVIDRASEPGGAMVGGAVASKTMREAALYLTGFKRRDTYEVSIDLTPDIAAARVRRRTADVVRTMTDSAVEN